MRSQLHVPAPWRDEAWATASNQVFDVVVVGGGITGGGIARDATLRGLRVALFERSDFGSGTSSRSSRLVHGGVRYLEHGHLQLVLESSRERRRLLRIAPHLVRPLAFTWPVYAGARIGNWKLSAGLALYDALALFRNVAPHRRLAPDEVLRDEPALRADALRGGARYYDAAADDARLVLANIVAASEQGATVLNYATVERVSAPRNGQAAWVVDVRDTLTQHSHQVTSRSVVFAVGPWSDEVAQLIGDEVVAPKARVVESLGAHVAVARRRVGNAGALTLLAPADGRVFFVLPARDLTIITTTESPAHAPPEEARAGRGDVQYLLAAVNHFFPAAQLAADDVVSAWAGVRPLAGPNAKGDLTSASREHTIAEAQRGLFVVTGGKLTTYRAMAEEVVDRVARPLLPRYREAVTHRVPLPGGELHDVRSAIEAVCRVVGDQAVAERLVFAYGARWPQVFDAADEDDLRLLSQDAPYLISEIGHAVKHEFALTLADILIRRMPLAFARADRAVGPAAEVAATLAERFAWGPSQIRQLLRDYEEAAERQFAIE
ncbi:MAG: glycerol-3-phosphate dehydrogenase/oxidase [Gemmatimonadaceae bacterium]